MVSYIIILSALGWAITVVVGFPDDPIKPIMMFISVSLLICFGVIAYIDFFKGFHYIEKLKLPMTDFEITEYENTYIIVYQNKAYALPMHHKRIIEKDHISATRYFDRKKKEIGYSLNFPYLRKVA